MVIRKFFKGLYRLFLLISIIIFVSNVYIVVERVVFKNDLPKIFGFAQVIVLSGSMHPEIEAGDFLIIYKSKTYHVDDIVTFRKEGSLITHRIIEFDGGDKVITKGDANNVNDALISTDKIEGRVALCIPNLGALILYSKTPFGILVLAAFGCLLFGILFVLDKLNHIRGIHNEF